LSFSSDTFAISRPYSEFNEDYHKVAFCQNIKNFVRSNTNDCLSASTRPRGDSTMPYKIVTSWVDEVRTHC